MAALERDFIQTPHSGRALLHVQLPRSHTLSTSVHRFVSACYQILWESKKKSTKKLRNIKKKYLQDDINITTNKIHRKKIMGMKIAKRCQITLYKTVSILMKKILTSNSIIALLDLSHPVYNPARRNILTRNQTNNCYLLIITRRILYACALQGHT